MEIKGQINKEVVDTLVKLMESVIGKRSVEIILRKLNNRENLKGKDLIYTFAEETQNLLGDKGGYATLRQVGRDLAKSLMNKYPQDKWEFILETALNDFGFARKIEKDRDCAYICGCVFYETLNKNHLKPTEHAVCWAGWGFIEGFVKQMYGVKGIKWQSRDIENAKCRFEFLK